MYKARNVGPSSMTVQLFRPNCLRSHNFRKQNGGAAGQERDAHLIRTVMMTDIETQACEIITTHSVQPPSTNVWSLPAVLMLSLVKGDFSPGTLTKSLHLKGGVVQMLPHLWAFT